MQTCPKLDMDKMDKSLEEEKQAHFQIRSNEGRGLGAKESIGTGHKLNACSWDIFYIAQKRG